MSKFAKNEKQTYVESYKTGSAKLREDKLPTCIHVNSGFEIMEAHVLKSGVVERDGKRLEFQEMRIYFKELP